MSKVIHLNMFLLKFDKLSKFAFLYILIVIYYEASKM